MRSGVIETPADADSARTKLKPVLAGLGVLATRHQRSGPSPRSTLPKPPGAAEKPTTSSAAIVMAGIAADAAPLFVTATPRRPAPPPITPPKPAPPPVMPPGPTLLT
ncbi:unnamed protein product [Closterium sp. NIES-53]